MNEKTHKTVIFVSNPFGFGPTGKTIALIEELSGRWTGKIVYAAGDMCQETIPENFKNKIIIETINERDETSLRTIFQKYENPFVVCTLNRLAIKTAKSLGLEAFFVDSLAWMWKEIPEEYLMADTYYCFDLFDIKSKLPPRNNIKVISPIFGNLPKTRATKDSFSLFHIGGFKNPFQDKLSFAYLNLLVEAFNLFDSSAPVVITGGKDAVSYMKGMLDRQNYDFCTLGRNDFLEQLSRTSHFITTSGLTATLEAFALQAPTSFIPPTNLSQWKILKLMSKQGCADSRVEWKDVLGDEIDLTDFSEKDAMPHFHKMAEETYKEAGYRGRFVNGVKAIMSKVPDITSLSQLINRAGTNGSQIIIDDLMVKLE